MASQRVALVDTGLCNLGSIRRALEECGARPFVTDQAADLVTADRIVLPGVGAFPDAMAALEAGGLDVALREEVVGKGAPFLGICLGMQLLADVGTEGSETKGLGFVGGRVVRLVPRDGERVPHVGWNELESRRPSVLLEGIPERADVYFVHSYHVECDDPEDVVAATPYCGGFASVLEHGNVFGTQFHPEKSQRFGFRVLQNFLSAC